MARLAALFQERNVPYALIGGLAVAAWGAPRATEDIDLLADVGPSSELDSALRAAGFEPEWRRGDPDDPIPLLLRLRSASGPEIDVVCATRAWEREMLNRSVRLRIPEGPETSVIAVEDLIVLKLMAGGPSDLADVADLLERVGPLPDLERQAAARGVSDLLRRVRASTGSC
ncbi:MAG: nucleotidyl transferase AbiEii/AbiGii toxin family protein [Deltaproteobacteria bacterium]|nr:nucleotidyl transferase AbiEii/AbiGii toxin family protein [Deltaproteobacteria bacterium]MBI3076474.1 nucleotidyl transferase AbiEii/AbiGii toxin family protein [Deltaproteobacteria bacterium]